VVDLKAIYLTALAQCAPVEVMKRFRISGFRSPGGAPAVVAIGKCAVGMVQGLAPAGEVFIAVPEGYAGAPRGHDGTYGRDETDGSADLTIGPIGPIGPIVSHSVHQGGHPQITPASFAAGRALLAFVDRQENIIFLISGGGSACVEVPLPPFTEHEITDTNRRLIDAGLPIREINTVRKRLSAIKGGKLAARVRGRAITLLYSDVSAGALSDIASGPTLPDDTTLDEAIHILRRIDCDHIVTKLRDQMALPVVGYAESHLLADNGTLTAAAAKLVEEAGGIAVRWEGQLEGDVEATAAALAARTATLREGEVLIAGGEPTVVKTGTGRGGRCSELALRFIRQLSAQRSTDKGQPATDNAFQALFASSDGVDGNSGAAGIFLPRLPGTHDGDEIARALAGSDSYTIAAQVGEPIMIAPTGNNLRDLFLMARG
jgi:hydroxypyruvate reductase